MEENQDEKTVQLRDEITTAEKRLRELEPLLQSITKIKQSEEEKIRENIYLEALHHTALDLMNRRDQREVLESILTRAGDVLFAPHGFVAIITDDHMIKIKVGTGIYAPYSQCRVKYETGLITQVWQAGAPVVINDYSAVPLCLPELNEERLHAVAGVPLYLDGWFTGVIVLGRQEDGRGFLQSEVDLLDRFAKLASLAMDNARLHMEGSQQLAVRIWAQQSLEEIVAFEKVLTNVSASFINVDGEEIDSLMEQALRLVGELFGMDRSYVFLLSDDGTMMTNTHEWCAAGVEPHKDQLQEIPTKAVPWLMEKLRTKETIRVSDVEELPEEAVQEREILKLHDVHSIIAVPMFSGSRLTGYVGIDAAHTERVWSDEHSGLLTILGELFVSAMQRRQAIIDLRTSEANYRTIFDAVNDGIIVQDITSGLIVDVNAKGCELYGYTREEMRQRRLEDIVTPTAAEEVLRLGQKSIIEEPQALEQLVRHRFGYEFWVEYRFIPVRINDRECLLVMVRDIHTRKQVEMQLRKLSGAVEQSPGVVIITDTKGQIEYVNPTFYQLYHYTPAEVLGKTPRLLKSGHQNNALYKQLWQTITAGNQWRGEFLNRRKNGETFWVLVSISPVRDHLGTVTHFVAIQEDITRPKQIEEQLKAKNDELHQTLEQLTLTQSQLVMQENLASIGQLAAGVAHEINNPLGFVSSNVETLRIYADRFREVLAEYRQIRDSLACHEDAVLRQKAQDIAGLERSKKIDVILADLDDIFNDSSEGLRRVSQIVKGLRLFSRVDQLNALEEYDLNLGIESALLVANNEIKYHAEVEKKLSDLPHIEAIGGQINQVLLNMLINSVHAIRAKDEGMGKITITTFCDQANVYCAIADNGEGMEPDIVAKIFKPFFTTKGIGLGTGLGLSISYDIIVHKHHGEIKVDTSPEKGTCFTIKLPILQAAATDELNR